jgi:adenylate cyclase
VGILILNIGLWKYYTILLNFSAMLICFIVSYLYITTIGYLSEGKSKRQIRKIFSRYLHEDVIKQLEDDPNRVQLGGKEIEATVLYTDIYDFTTISETKTPKELVENLNEYFEELTGNILKHQGLLDKYTGDGIMAIFGAPLTRKDHAILACKAAFVHKKMRESFKDKEDNTAPELFHIGTRTGINSGLLVAGNIGSEKRMDYTAIGDTVNLAARLEGVNKIYKTNIIISEATYKHVEDIFLCRELDYLRVKGKNEPTRIYELIDEIDNEKDYQWLTKYAEAVRLYREGSWKIAIKMFQELTEEPVNDSASQVMLDRCIYLKKNPPDNWDGILTLEVK